MTHSPLSACCKAEVYIGRFEESYYCSNCNNGCDLYHGSPKPLADAQPILSLCPSCNCMTHNINGVCGKCHNLDKTKYKEESTQPETNLGKSLLHKNAEHTLSPEQEERLKEYECTGYRCNHETAEDHFIIQREFLIEEIAQAVEEERERIKLLLDNDLIQPRYWSKSLESPELDIACDGLEYFKNELRKLLTPPKGDK